MNTIASLSAILNELPFPILSRSVKDLTITGVVADNRKVQPGMAFVAIKGETVDAHRFIPDAVTRGAAAIIGTEPDIQIGVPYIQVADSRLALPYLSAGFFGYPARKMTMIGITGTDGKTTTTNLVFSILGAAGLRAGMVSTVNAVIGNEVFDTGFHVTTPEAPDTQRYLAMMVDAGLTHAVFETTSHGWAQHRVEACEFDIGVLTNITHEHLNDHGSFENYRLAKARLFQSLQETHIKVQGNPKLAVLNFDDSSYAFMHTVCLQLNNVNEITYSLAGETNLLARDIQYRQKGLDFIAVVDGKEIPIHSALEGAYNVSNILAAIGATQIGLRIPAQAVQDGIAKLSGIPGRMEHIDLGQDFTAIVDFAHTPNALLRTLETARQMTNGRVIVVFGSAGLRDRQKRIMMAEIAVQLADLTILTAEDPRTESLAEILDEMALSAHRHGGIEGKNFVRIQDRGAAIQYAVDYAAPGDLVIACGKGHEQSMCFGETEYSWDDRTAMRAALAARLGTTGPAMPYLPTQDSTN